MGRMQIPVMLVYFKILYVEHFMLKVEARQLYSVACRDDSLACNLEQATSHSAVSYFNFVDQNHKMSSNLTCVFKCEEVTDKIMKFTEKDLQQCREKLNIRVACNMKYSDVVFPDCMEDVYGYHSVCRKNFLAIPKKYIKKYEELQNTSVAENANPPLVDAASTSFTSASGTENIELVATQSTPMSVDREEDEASGNQTSSIREQASHEDEVSDDDEADDEAADDDSLSNQESGEQICFFCNKRRKIYKYRVVPLHSSVVEKLRNDIFRIANETEDREISNKLESVGSNSIIHYHNPCKTIYFKKRNTKPATNTSWHKKKQFHESAYADLCGFIAREILGNKKCHFLQFLTDCYNEMLESLYFQEFNTFDVKYTSQHLLEKLQKTYNGQIQVILIHKKKAIAPINGCVIDDETFSEGQDFELLSRAALILRKKVLLIAKKPLPGNVKVSDIIAGECEIPKDLEDFTRTLLCGIDSRTLKSSDCARKVDSISQDIIYAIHHGRMKTSKHKVRK